MQSSFSILVTGSANLEQNEIQSNKDMIRLQFLNARFLKYPTPSWGMLAFMTCGSWWHKNRAPMAQRLLDSELAHAAGYQIVVWCSELVLECMRAHDPETREVKTVDGMVVAKLDPISLELYSGCLLDTSLQMSIKIMQKKVFSTVERNASIQ